MDEREKILIDNFKEYFGLGQESYKRGLFNGATTLFFKSIVALCDIYVLRKTGNVPSSHSDRFRILEKDFKEIYDIADRDFPFYQDSYTKKMNREAAKLLKEDAEKIKNALKI